MLLDEFSVIFDRPEKIKKLREYILSLAVRGKLVPQDENDEPVSVLLERIREEKDRLVKEKKIKKEKSLSEISVEEIPYELPKGWEFIKIQDIAFVTKLSGFEYTKYIAPNIGNNNKVKLLKGKNIKKRYVNLDCEDSITLELSEELHRSALTKKCLLTPFVGSLGNIAILDTKERYHLGANVAKIEIFNNDYTNIKEEYLLYYFLSPLGERQLTKHRKATAQESISMGAIRDSIIGVPPLNEQKRIVEKLDYLMEFCDKLEKQLEKKVKYGSLSAKSILNDVSNCSTYEELEETLRFIIDNFKDLTLTDGAVDALKNTILSLAVNGKLVPQDENDEPASVLLEKIREKKDRLVKEKKIKKENQLPEISEGEVSYELPKGWEWVRLGDIGQIVGGGTPKTNNPEYFSDDEIVWLTPADLNGLKEKYIFKGRRYISKLGLEKSSAQLLPKGSVLFSSRAPIGYVAIAEVDLSTNQGFKSCVPYIMDTNEYIYYTLKLKGKEIDENASGTTFKEVSGKIVSQVIIPLPPLNEQKRIVEKIDKLMTVCDELELKIEKSKKYSEKLMESILKDSFKA